MIAVSPPLAKVCQSFGAPEYFSRKLLGLIAAVVLAHGSIIKAVAMIVLGLLVGLVGTDGNTGGTRFTFGIRELTDGIDVATLAIGVFGVGEIISISRPEEPLWSAEDHRLWPTGDSGARGGRCCAAPRFHSRRAARRRRGAQLVRRLRARVSRNPRGSARCG